MDRQREVASGGRAVVVAAGPPGSRKTEALKTLDLRGYRLIDPDDAKDMILDDAERHGLLSYHHDYTLPDGGPMGDMSSPASSAQVHHQGRSYMLPRAALRMGASERKNAPRAE